MFRALLSPLPMLFFVSSATLAVAAAPVDARRHGSARDFGNPHPAVAVDDAISILVSTTADAGEGSLRDAIEQANESCGAGGPTCRITFAFAAAAPEGDWQTIRPLTPLPSLGTGVILDGTTAPDTNPLGPDVEIQGTPGGPASGLVIAGCDTVVTGVAVNGFDEYGIRVEAPGEPCPILDGAVLVPVITGTFIGTDPTGSTAIPNGLRGIGIFLEGSQRSVEILENVISGNTRSGIWIQGGSNHLISKNRIGLAAHAETPLPNFASGIYIAPAGGDFDIWENTIAFNGEWGVALHPHVFRVSLRRNSIHSHFALGIDYGLDFVTPNDADNHIDLIYGRAIPNHPVLTSARYDAATDTTVVEGTLERPIIDSAQVGAIIELFASPAPDRSGFGEGAVYIGSVQIAGGLFTFSRRGDLGETFITATSTVFEQIGFAKPQPNTLRTGFWEKTSEFSNAVPVTR